MGRRCQMRTRNIKGRDLSQQEASTRWGDLIYQEASIFTLSTRQSGKKKTNYSLGRGSKANPIGEASSVSGITFLRSWIQSQTLTINKHPKPESHNDVLGKKRAEHSRDKAEITALRPTRELLKQKTGTNSATVNFTAWPENSAHFSLTFCQWMQWWWWQNGSWFFHHHQSLNAAQCQIRESRKFWIHRHSSPSSTEDAHSPLPERCRVSGFNSGVHTLHTHSAPLHTMLILPLLQLKPQTCSTWVNLSSGRRSSEYRVLEKYLPLSTVTSESKIEWKDSEEWMYNPTINKKKKKKQLLSGLNICCLPRIYRFWPTKARSLVSGSRDRYLFI